MLPYLLTYFKFHKLYFTSYFYFLIILKNNNICISVFETQRHVYDEVLMIRSWTDAYFDVRRGLSLTNENRRFQAK